MFHRVDMHTMLLETATQEEGEGTPCSVVVDHIAKELDHEKGTVTFENGITIQADLIIGADGIRASPSQREMGKSRADPSLASPSSQPFAPSLAPSPTPSRPTRLATAATSRCRISSVLVSSSGLLTLESR